MSQTIDHPRCTPAEAERLVQEWYGLEASATELPSYIDRNFRMRSDEGDFVLKVANAQTAPEDVEFECRVMEALAEARLDITTPRIQPTHEGKPLFALESGDESHLCRLVSFVPGTLWADAGEPSDARLRSLGAELARVDRVLGDIEAPRHREGFRWDIAHTAWIGEYLGAVRSDWRGSINNVLLQFLAQLAPALGDLPKGLIHNDANDYNLTAEGDRTSGLFDFGDTIHSCRLFEPAIAATYAAFHRPGDALDALCEVAAGYHSELPLTDLETEMFLHAVRARLAISLVSSALAAKSMPQNEYAAVSEQAAWQLLEETSAVSPREFCDRLRLACGLEPHPKPRRSPEQLAEARARLVGPNLSLSYGERALSIDRGRMQYLFDEDGRAYLDGVNNVSHVGHCHPRVNQAAADQMSRLNTNTRYLHNTILDYAERLAATLPDPLEVCFFVCSGSEANELAIRLARSATGRSDLLALDHAYHGTTSTLIGLSAYKFAGPGGEGPAPGVHIAPAPDPYREARGRNGAEFADETVGRLLADHPIAALLAESLPGCAGQIVPPPGYLARAFDLAREAGAIAIADEVQTGFGRVGSHMWAFEAQGAVPDIVTLGKPIGNGHPMAAVVTTRSIADRFANGMEYFNTFGGNPVSCAVGMAVLDVIDDDGLQQNAAEVGGFLLGALRDIQSRHPGIGDVRGLGLFIGIELVKDCEDRAPDPQTADAVVRRCREEGILLSTDGPQHNVIKIKPPLPFDIANARMLVDAVDRALDAVEPL